MRFQEGYMESWMYAGRKWQLKLVSHWAYVIQYLEWAIKSFGKLGVSRRYGRLAVGTKANINPITNFKMHITAKLIG